MSFLGLLLILALCVYSAVAWLSYDAGVRAGVAGDALLSSRRWHAFVFWALGYRLGAEARYLEDLAKGERR